MLCFTFFFEYVRPQTIYPVIDILPYSQLFLLGTVISATFDKTVTWVSHTQNKLFVMFLVLLVLSGIFAFDPKYSWEARNSMLGWVLFYFLTITIVNTEKRFFLFLLAYLLFSFKMAQNGAMTWALRGFSFASYGLVGAPGYFQNSGEFAIQMLIYGSLAIALVISLKPLWGKYKKWFKYIAAATGYMSVIGSSSRGSQLGLAVIAIWMLLRQKGGFKGLLAMLVIAGSLYLLLPDEQMARLSEMGDDKTSQLRLDYWNYALKEVIPDNLLIGVGYSNWMPYLYEHIPQGIGVYGQIQEVHNIYLQIAAEAGIFGFLVFLLMIVMSFVTSVRTRRIAQAFDNRLYYNLSYGLDAGMVGYLVAGTFVTVFYYPFFWIQIAMVVMLYNVVALKAAQESAVVAVPGKGKRGRGSRGARGVARQSNAPGNIR